MMRTKIERCIFFFLLAVVAVRISMVGDFGSHGSDVIAEQREGLTARPKIPTKIKPSVQPSGDTARVSAASPLRQETRQQISEVSKAINKEPMKAVSTPEAVKEVEARMDAREKAAEKVIAPDYAGAKGGVQQVQAAAVTTARAVVPQETPTPAKGSGRGSKNAKGLQAEKEPKLPGRKEEGASWSVLDNLKISADGTRLVTHKRQFIVYNETLNHTVLRHWLEYQDGNETLIYHFPRSLFELLPLEEPQWRFKTCAVVGNSGVVLLRENGAEIDAHDAVFRINMAPVRGFEHYVGKKTTFNVVNSHNVRELLQGLRHWTGSIDGGESQLVMFETASHFARYHLCQPLLKKFPQANPLLLNPIFSNRAHRVWVQLKYLLEQKENSQYNRKPMSGFFSTFFALNICDKVDLYGFDAYTSKKRSYRYHYFDNVQGFTDVHSFDLAIEVFKLIAKKGLLQIVT